jgi:RNA polymerase sigma-70 factor, ECF subfamily
METESAETRVLLDMWRAGDEEAARELFDRYADRLLALARSRISARLNSRVDPEDVVQSVFRTFFFRVKEGKFSFHDQDDLSKLLVRITVHKTLRQVEFHKAAKRDPGMEAPQDDIDHDRIKQVLDSQPTPQAAVTFLNELEHFLGRLTKDEREILELRLQGYSNREIAEKLNIYDRKIRRVLERVKALAEQECLALKA